MKNPQNKLSEIFLRKEWNNRRLESAEFFYDRNETTAEKTLRNFFYIEMK